MGTWARTYEGKGAGLDDKNPKKEKTGNRWKGNKTQPPEMRK